jgi:hypothetical protein
MTINDQSLQDQFEWDVLNKENSPEVPPLVWLVWLLFF